MTVQELKDLYIKFFTLYNGKSIEYSDATNKFQCMDGAGKWCEKLGIPYDAIRHLYAYQVWTQPTDLTRKYFDLVSNGPTNTPPVGALVVFGTKVGYAGHISVGTAKSTSKDYVGFEQNWNGKQYMTTVTHYNYSGILGWLIPKTSSVTGSIPKSSIVAIRDGGGSESEKYNKIINLL